VPRRADTSRLPELVVVVIGHCRGTTSPSRKRWIWLCSVELGKAATSITWNRAMFLTFRTNAGRLQWLRRCYEDRMN
jgi:hypothetical protein